MNTRIFKITLDNKKQAFNIELNDDILDLYNGDKDNIRNAATDNTIVAFQNGCIIGGEKIPDLRSCHNQTELEDNVKGFFPRAVVTPWTPKTVVKELTIENMVEYLKRKGATKEDIMAMMD